MRKANKVNKTIKVMKQILILGLYKKKDRKKKKRKRKKSKKKRGIVKNLRSKE